MSQGESKNLKRDYGDIKIKDIKSAILFMNNLEIFYKNHINNLNIDVEIEKNIQNKNIKTTIKRI